MSRAAALLLLAAFGGPVTVWEGQSSMHSIRVVDTDDRRALFFNDYMQSLMRKESPLTGHFDYVEAFHLTAHFLGRPGTMCMLGLGGGSAARTWLARHAEWNVVVAEVDPLVLDVAQRWFHLPAEGEDERLGVRLMDARQMFRRDPDLVCDVVLVDAYSASRHGAWIPWHLATREFFSEVRAHMPDDGILAYNVIGTLDRAGSWPVQAITKTLRTQFDTVWALPVETSINVVLFAFGQAPEGPEGWRHRVEQAGAAPRLGALAPLLTSRVPEGATVPVLTDEYAPIDVPGLMVDQ